MLPRISIVTPSFNQGKFLEDTIISVLDQGYPNLEYIVIDGGSTDSSKEILEKYSPRLSYWVSEKDHGQTEAINKGLRKITGDLWGYLCSDDTLTPDALSHCVKAFDRTGADVISGNCNFITSEGAISRIKRPGRFDRARLLRANYLYQPSMFMKRWVLDSFGYFDESLHYSMDYEFWLRISSKARIEYVDEVFSNYRLHLNSKSMKEVVKMMEEGRQVQHRYGAGRIADINYYSFVVWGQYYYSAKRHLFDTLAKWKDSNATIR